MNRQEEAWLNSQVSFIEGSTQPFGIFNAFKTHSDRAAGYKTVSPAAVDSDREESKMGNQPPQHSLIVPRVVLPSAPQQQAFPVAASGKQGSSE